ncbi:MULTISPECIES: DUF4232 domain-containing protein [Streptomyces]|uniref:DUF4232 domain-containing protein n=1 Tax=Streptomyces TaxID=1883 RepID=UPI003446A6D2
MSHHTTLHRGRKTVAATVIAAAALTLTACQGGKSDAAGTPSAAASAAASGGGSSDSGASNGGSSAAQGSSGAGAGQGASAQGGGRGSASQHTGSGAKAGPASARHGATARCTTAGLQAGWGSSGGGVPDMHGDAQQTAAVWLKNTSSSSCTLSGFPGVQIKGTDGRSLDLPRSAQKPARVTLKPGGTASFTIRLLPSVRDGDRKIEPGMVLITPPNQTQHFQLKWPYGGAILDQSGATHPGTFVNPIHG